MRVTSDTSLEELVGIQPEWDKEQINKHLRSEFKKWTSRLTSATNQDERDNAQEKIDIIGDLRKKYE